MWNRLPIWFRAVVTGLVVSGIPTTIWAVLAAINLRTTPHVPWSVPVMAVVLWLFWRYATRFDRERLRAKPISTHTWRLSLLAGGSAVAAVWALFQALRPLLHIVPQANDVAKVPVITIAAAILMGCAVAGIAEEAGFRGFMQLPLERAYGPAVAIGVTAVIFTSVHLTHGAAVIPFLPFYLAVAAVYGLLAYYTGSIVPGIVLHFAGDVMMFAVRVIAARQGVAPGGAVSPLAEPAFCAFLVLSIVLFRMLVRDARATRQGTPAVA